MYLPKDQYVWDFWMIFKDHQCYLFHLQAPPTPQDPMLRHNAAAVGLVVSDDLRQWTDCGTVFRHGRDGEWDDLSIWTGSVTRGGDNRFYFLYTGRNRSENGRVQRIGLAASDDLLHWDRVCNGPVISADERYYETIGSGSDYRWESWRDPYLYYDDCDHVWYAFITARRNHGNSMTRGCIGVARSADLIRWSVLPPLDTPALFADMEVPTVWKKDNRYYLTFCSKDIWFGGDESQVPGLRQTGNFLYTSDSLLGRYELADNPVLLGTASGCYTDRVIRDATGNDYLLSWYLYREERNVFTGGITDPYRLIYRSPVDVVCEPANEKIRI